MIVTGNGFPDWLGLIIGAEGAFMCIIGALNVYFLNDLRGRLSSVEDLVNNKKDKESCELDQVHCGDLRRQQAQDEKETRENMWTVIHSHSHTGLDTSSEVIRRK